MKHIEEFISNLAVRFRNENDLSDITWSMCQSSMLFKKMFLGFFNFKEINNGNVAAIDIQREVSNEDSRPDFVFEVDGKEYLIENKIWDRDLHYEKYIKTYKITERGRLKYITAYTISKEDYYADFYTWKHFYEYLKEKVPSEEYSLWAGYLDYIKQVCNIFYTDRPMDLKGMFSLYSFYNSLDGIFELSGNGYNSTLYLGSQKGGNSFSSPIKGAMGKYFEIDVNSLPSEKIRGWMGVYFNKENPDICICFYPDKGWGKPVYDYFKNNNHHITGESFKGPDEEDGAIWFEFSKAEEFDQKKNITSQIELLQAFFKEVVETAISKISPQEMK